jgi:hypothetical protein
MSKRIVATRADRMSNAHVGNCVRCGHWLAAGDYVRVPGVLGKTCLNCAAGRTP